MDAPAETVESDWIREVLEPTLEFLRGPDALMVQRLGIALDSIYDLGAGGSLPPDGREPNSPDEEYERAQARAWRESDLPAEAIEAIVRGLRQALDDELSLATTTHDLVDLALREAPYRLNAPEVRGAFHRATSLIDQVVRMRDEMVAPATSDDRCEELVDAINALYQSLCGLRKQTGDAQTNLIRTDVINCFVLVADLYLPELLSALVAQRLVIGERLNWFLAPMLTQHDAVRALVNVRWPEFADLLEPDEIGEIVARFRRPQFGSKWERLAALFHRLDLYSSRGDSEAAAESVRQQYSKNPARVPEVTRDVRFRYWRRLSAWLLLFGFGRVDVDAIDSIWAGLATR